MGTTGKQMKKNLFREEVSSFNCISIGILGLVIAGYVLSRKAGTLLMVFVIAAVTALFVYLCVMIAV